MTWFKTDDKMHEHRKVRARSLAAMGLWAVTGSWSADNRTDGFVPESVARRWPGWKKAAAELVGAGLWEPAQRDGELGWQFHDWADWQPTKQETETPTERVRWRRRKALERDRLLCERIVERDRNQCRYCRVRVNWSDRRGPHGGTYDHVDPDGDNSLGNVVVACRRCNGRKRDRTPAEAGLTLLPVPEGLPRDLASAKSDLAEPGPRPETGQIKPGPGQVEPGPDLASRARHARDGTGQVGASLDLAPGQVPARSGQVAPDPAAARSGNGSAP